MAGVRQAAFKSRLHRGRMPLRALLEPYLRLEQVALTDRPQRVDGTSIVTPHAAYPERSK